MIKVVFVKEFIDHLRDRRSMLASLVLPFLGPLLLVGVFRLVMQMQKEKPLEVPVIGAEYAPNLTDYLERQGAKLLPPPADPEELVRRGDADMVLVIDRSYGEDFLASQSAKVELIIDDSRNDSRKNVRQLERILLSYSQGLGALRLLARGVSPELAAPIALTEIDLATPQKLAANLLNIVPLFLMLAAFVGGMNLAIDSTAGERERGSLEPLLLNPVPRAALVLGKWLATALTSALIALVTLAGFMVTMHFLPLEELGMRVSFGAREALLVTAALLPLTLFGAALQMLIATFARSFKEAQTYLNLLNLLPTAPSMLLMLEPTHRNWWMLPIPTLAQVGTIVDVLRGEAIPGWHLVVITLTSVAYAAGCLVCLAHLLGRERIIFGRP